ncbi:MAG TPA: SMI1/KNR4 family protein, partial [Polyangiaceae bacterium]|nr:SMI1/KNR4 family protein [Polyangiaceae bacterium]
MSAVEEQVGVRLPDDYRVFLLEVGAGGAGPGYGIFLLARADGWGWDGDGATLTGDLATPFPHANEWNVTFEEWDEEAEAEDAYWARRDVWNDDVYWHPKQTTGAICICHEGCALRDWLVVTGPQRGMMWSDQRAD